MTPIHDANCRCDSCLAWFTAFQQRNPDGTPFFSDAELEELAALRDTPRDHSHVS